MTGDADGSGENERDDADAPDEPDTPHRQDDDGSGDGSDESDAFDGPGDDRSGDRSDHPPSEETVAALLDAARLKERDRMGWVERGVPDPESVAAHSWGVTFLALVVADDWAAAAGESVDLDRVLALALVHDLAEAETGDIPEPAASAEGRHRRERPVMEAFADRLGVELDALWTEAETADSPEARLVREADKLEMALQACRYAQRADDPEQFEPFFESAAERVETDYAKELLQQIRRVDRC